MADPVVSADERGRLTAWAAERGLDRREAGWIIDHVGAHSADVGTSLPRDDQFRSLAERRLAGEPLQYVLGRWDFRSLEVVVDGRVLIPRPETEQVVEVALSELAAVLALPDRDEDRGAVCVDLGTGSGVIALAVATEWPRRQGGLEMWAVDRSPDALEVAKVNIERLAPTVAAAGARVRPVLGVWFDALPARLLGTIDLVVANPPYVSACELASLDPVVREWEPESALVSPAGSGGIAGFADIETIVTGAGKWLRPGGALVVEMDPRHGGAALASARTAGLRRVRTSPDLTGRTRMLVASA